MKDTVFQNSKTLTPYRPFSLTIENDSLPPQESGQAKIAGSYWIDVFVNGVFVQTNDFFLDRVPRSGTYFFEDWLGACGCDPPQTMLRLNILESGNAPHYLRVFSGLTYKDGVIAGAWERASQGYWARGTRLWFDGYV